MKKRLFSLTYAIFFLFFCLSPYVSAGAEELSPSPESLLPTDSDLTDDGEYTEGTVLVTIAAPDGTSLTKEGTASFDPCISIEGAYDFGSAEPLADTEEQKEILSDKTLYISEVSSDTYSTQELMNKLANKAYVIQVEPDYEQHLTDISGDPYRKEQWHLDGEGTFTGSSTGISFSSVQGRTKTGSPVIAVMDTGIDYTHEDLADHMWVNSDITLPGIHGYNFIDDTPDCSDVHGHGTHCAGTIAAVSDNGTGISGISDAKLMSLKIFGDDGSTHNSDIVQAMNYVLQAKLAGVNIIAVNCSWGGGSSGTALRSLVERIGEMGVLFVFASGNDAINHDMPTGLSCPYDMYIGAYSNNRNYMIITGSSDINDMPSSFSDFGKKDVDLFAPGENILSTYTETNYFAGIYEDETERQLTASLFSFGDDTETTDFYTDEGLDIPSDITAGISHDPTKDYRSGTDSGSLKWTLDFGPPRMSKTKSAYLYLDVTDQNPDLTATYYISMLFGSFDSDGNFVWEHVQKVSEGSSEDESNRFYIAPDGRIYLKIIGLETEGIVVGIKNYYLDDIGISCADPDVSLFGKYDTNTGSSMAAPMVTGAVALLSEIYSDDSAANRRGRLLTCTRTTSGASGKCATDGVLDLRSIDTYVPTANVEDPSSDPGETEQPPKVTTPPVKKIAVKKIAIKAPKTKLKAGKKLKLKAVITPANATTKTVKWSSSKKKWASVTKKGVVTAKKKGRGHTVKITAAATDGSRKKASVKIRIKK